MEASPWWTGAPQVDRLPSTGKKDPTTAAYFDITQRNDSYEYKTLVLIEKKTVRMNGGIEC